MLLSTLLLLLATAREGIAGFNISSKNNVALYWGQNSADPNVDIIIVAFLLRFVGNDGNPVLNFANQGVTAPPDPVKCTYFPGSTGLFQCPDLEADIQECQIKKGKTVLLSIGGDAYTEGGFPNPEAATAAAGKIWAMFGPPQDDIYHPYPSQVYRPFGYASVDGFDFDFEGPNAHSSVFAQRLRQLMDDYTNGVGNGRKFYLSAAPQCPYPDVWMKELMQEAQLDMVFVQFYNNWCGVHNYVPGSPNPFNFHQWDTWARTASKNKNVKIFVGVPGNTGAAGRGYVPAPRLAPIIQEFRKKDAFGGVMIWDASQAYTNGDFLEAVKGALTESHTQGQGQPQG
ncbi:glycoside hydrolase [Westerdykella ornata]|uniref:chitinase n=1 Tax=Westerdykella ornata TaxID=318751 RepID=A0A6A6JCS4_WESOR|nr:glycoside hydrolase [Westerdykella ornata]KAF2272989.1 glycoside hydrolase [Westerdykella ornata]